MLGGLKKVETVKVNFTVNGESHDIDVEPRRMLADVLRHDLYCFGVHLGCEHGVCGACTIIVDGAAVRSCLMLAAQAQGSEIVTTEGLGTPEHLHPVQQAFNEEHALQCGFCTPGFVCTITAMLPEIPDMDDTELRNELSGNICRCTGYANILRAARSAAQHQETAGLALSAEAVDYDDD